MISKNELMSAYRSKEPADSSQGHAQEQSTISRFYIHDRWRPIIFLLELHRSKENLFIRHIWTPLEKKNGTPATHSCGFRGGGAKIRLITFQAIGSAFNPPFRNRLNSVASCVCNK